MGFGEDLAALGQQFNLAANQLAMQRAVSGATDAVNQIKAQEGDEIQKQQQLRQVSEALTRDLAQFGAPADRIALIANSIAKPQAYHQTADEALINEKEGSPVYNQAMKLKQWEFAQQKDIANIKAKQAQQNIKDFEKFNDDLNPYNTKIYGKNQEKVDQASRLSALIYDPKGEIKSLSSRQMAEASLSAANMLNNGNRVAHEMVKELMPPGTGPATAAAIEERLKNAPQDPKNVAFVREIGNLVERERQVALRNIRTQQARIAYGKYGHLADANESAFTSTVTKWGLNPDHVQTGIYTPPKDYQEPNPFATLPSYQATGGNTPTPQPNGGGQQQANPLAGIPGIR